MPHNKMPEWEVKLRIELETAGYGNSCFNELFYVTAPGDWQARRNAKRQAKTKYSGKLIHADVITCKKV